MMLGRGRRRRKDRSQNNDADCHQNWFAHGGYPFQVIGGSYHDLRSNSGSLAMLAAIRGFILAE
jgi:hypothetical protein